MKNYSNGRLGGFTLIELLVVVLIIGILAAVALPQYDKAVVKARAVETITELNAIEKGQIAYFLANNQYTANLDDLDITIQNPQNYNCHEGAPHGSFCQGTVEKGRGLRFEWVWPQSVWPAGEHRCLAPVSNDLANEICKTYGATFFKVEGTTNYYILK